MTKIMNNFFIKICLGAVPHSRLHPGIVDPHHQLYHHLAASHSSAFASPNNLYHIVHHNNNTATNPINGLVHATSSVNKGALSLISPYRLISPKTINKSYYFYVIDSLLSVSR